MNDVDDKELFGQPLGRADITVPRIWRLLPAADDTPAIVVQSDVKPGTTLPSGVTFVAVEIGPDVLDRQGDAILVERLANVGRNNCDLVIVSDVSSADVKLGWPMHRLQQLRDRNLCNYFAIEADNPLEAEWLTANTPIHAVITRYKSTDMAVRYRLFDIAKTAGVAIICRGKTRDEIAFALGTPDITAVITDQDTRELPRIGGDVIDNIWQVYTQENPEPPKLRSAHPPEA